MLSNYQKISIQMLNLVIYGTWLNMTCRGSVIEEIRQAVSGQSPLDTSDQNATVRLEADFEAVSNGSKAHAFLANHHMVQFCVFARS